MIHYIGSDLPTFKAINFHPGLNLLLADKSPGATDRQTRNGAGKTSLIELIHFLLGSDCDKESIFKNEALVNYRFGIDFDLKDSRTIVERTGQAPSKVDVLKSDFEGWPLKPSTRKNSPNVTISNKVWRHVLGALMFALKDATEDEEKFNVTFRSLFAYFVRRQHSGAFRLPFKQAEMQQLGDQQVAISYLLGFDWSIPQRWQQVRIRERSLKELRKAATEGAFGSIISTTAELRTKLTVAEERTRQMRENISKFHVLPEYQTFERDASDLTRQLGTLADENTIDRQLLKDLEQSMQSETVPSADDVESLYREAGIILPDTVVRRFDDVKAFHESVIQNRRMYLDGEIQAAKRRINLREEQMRNMDSRRAQIMQILNTHGALEQRDKLHAELARQEAETESIRQRYIAAEQLEGQKTELDIERGQLLIRLRQDFREQSDVLRRAILAFEETSRALYEEAGSLTISESINGPQYEVKIHGAKSKGISNMQIFCFDMMLMRICAEREMGPGFLIHDSHLFDGVDERQIAKALQVGAETAREVGFQYIVTMNSDAIPKELPDEFSLDEYILPVRLTDATEDGGLFGLRFE
jgi:uncharacterized protein YydD (DUF2326 family)